MAGGWAQDGAVNEQIEASINDELARMRAQRKAPVGESLTHCADCDEPIPEARRQALFRTIDEVALHGLPPERYRPEALMRMLKSARRCAWTTTAKRSTPCNAAN